MRQSVKIIVVPYLSISVLPGIESNLAISSSPVTKTMYIFSNAYGDCMKRWKISSSAPDLSLMTRREYRVDRLFPVT
jgi:hypothetical protein